MVDIKIYIPPTSPQCKDLKVWLKKDMKLLCSPVAPAKQAPNYFQSIPGRYFATEFLGGMSCTPCLI